MRIRTSHKDVDKSMHSTSAPLVFLCGHKAHQDCFRFFFFSMQMRGVGLKNGVPYLQMGLSTLAWRVSRRPEDKITCFNYSIPRRFFSLASRHSTSVFFACKTQISPSVCINGLPSHKMESSNIACASERGTKVWSREYNLPVPRRFFLLGHKAHPSLLRGLFSMQMGGVGFKNGVPY